MHEVSPAGRKTIAEEVAGRLLHSAVQKLYTACLKQMALDKRWFQRPFVYGFAREKPASPES